MSYDNEEFRHRSLPDQVADHIVILIAKGEISAGDRLYENELCKTLGVSRVPVREALRLLQAQGVVRTEPNRGNFVRHHGSDETTEMLRIRLTVERLALRRAIPAVRRDPANLRPLRRALEQMRVPATTENRVAACQADLEFHQSIVRLSESATLMTVWEMLARGILVFLAQERDAYYDNESNIRDHEILLEAIEVGKLGVLDELIEDHILRVYLARQAQARAPSPAS
ncbi:GntR family transcriptional regulator [Amaricoccus solimangrovi]|uniref:GntR family transcriptional regulator n=1 Tax=Amaricoccus solimangrovi TaxID=2589815 RepID=A0A501WF38_9RHOB|nr:GntR family transcriptional regulator [Amaricoccus solimangrovi]TPE48038.1 GntR family transcriptional regulator [Amaricoccus solimangrovi]